MIGKGSGHVKPDLIFTARRKNCLLLQFSWVFLALREMGHTSEFIGFSGLPLWTEASRRHFDGDMIVHGFTDLLTLATADATFSCHDNAQYVKIHRKSLCRTLRRTGMAALRRRAQLMRHRCEPHANVISPFDRQQGIGRASGDARRVVTEVTRNLVRENHRRSVLLMKDD